MKKILNILLPLFLVTLVSTSALAADRTASILKITDGDTVWVKSNHKRIKLRLLGIDTPEEYYSKKMLKDVKMCGTTYNKMKRLGLLATKHAETMLNKGDNISVETFGKGYYGRTLAFVILPDGTNYNEQEVVDGYACVYKYHGHKSKELSWAEMQCLCK